MAPVGASCADRSSGSGRGYPCTGEGAIDISRVLVDIADVAERGGVPCYRYRYRYRYCYGNYTQYERLTVQHHHDSHPVYHRAAYLAGYGGGHGGGYAAVDTARMATTAPGVTPAGTSRTMCSTTPSRTGMVASAVAGGGAQPANYRGGHWQTTHRGHGGRRNCSPVTSRGTMITDTMIRTTDSSARPRGSTRQKTALPGRSLSECS